MSQENSTSTRLHHLDGLRGIASFAVFLWHNFLAFFPGAVDPQIPMQAPWLERWIFRSPLAILFAGDFAVYIFFVLSGFVITVRLFAQKDPDLVRKSFFRRYVRLMPPAAVTVFASYILLTTGLMYNKEASVLAHSWWLALNWSAVDATLINATWTAFYGIWFVGIPVTAHFNSNLGTLLIELVGSYIIFAYLTIAFTFSWSLCKRVFVLFALILSSFFILKDDPHFTVFFVGVLFADIYVHRPLIFEKLAKLSFIWLLIGIFLGSSNIGNIPTYPYHIIEVFFRAVGLHPLSNPWALGALFIMLGTLTSSPARKLLQSTMLQEMGKYSFALFVAHSVFLGSFTCWLFIVISKFGYMSYTWNVFAAFILGLPFLFGIVYLIRKIDDVSVRVSRRL